MNKYDRNVVTTASNAEADLACPGRFQAQIGIPDKTTPDAKFGREVHVALSTGDPSRLSFEQKDIYDSIQAIETAVVVEFFGANAPNAIKHVMREEPWTYGVGEWLHGCTPDVVYRYLEMVLIVEYKSLSGDIAPAQSNLQMRDQVVVVYHNYFLVKEIGSVVIQPLATHKPQICVYTKSDILLATRDLHDRVNASHKPDAQRIAGEKQCSFCRAKPLCKEYQLFATSQLPVPVTLMDMPVALWSPQQRTIFCEHKGVAGKWLKDTYEAMKHGAKKDPDFVPGWELDDGDERRTITDLQKLFDRFSAYGGTMDRFLKCMKLTIGEFTEAVSEVSKLKGKKLKNLVDIMFDGIVETHRSEPALVKKKEKK